VTSRTWDGNTPNLILLVLDGSWDQVRALQAEIEDRRRVMGHQSPLPCIRLEDAAVQNFESPLIDALRPGAGKGRISTLEACALLLREAEDCWPVSPGTWKEALKGLKPMVHVLQQRLELPTFSGESNQLEALIATLRKVAAKAPLQDGLRRCCVCGAAFATPLRMRDHLSGRRHCTAVAFQHFSTKEKSSGVDEEEAKQIFEAYSTVPLSKCHPEPPDVALVKLKDGPLLARETREKTKRFATCKASTKQ